MADVLLSFVLPAHNEEALIGAAIDSIHESAKPLNRTYEIIVSCDACTDRTAEIAERKGARAIQVNNRQIAATRNCGARVANGEYLVFLDADTILTRDALKDAFAALDSGAVGGGGLVQLEGKLPLIGRIFMSVFSFAYFKVKRLAAGCFVFARRDAFEKVGGFDEHYFASEEIHLSQALKRCGKFVIVKSHVISSGRKMRMHSLGQILRLFGRLVWNGKRGLQKREGLEFWYDGRREEHAPR